VGGRPAGYRDIGYVRTRRSEDFACDTAHRVNREIDDRCSRHRGRGDVRCVDRHVECPFRRWSTTDDASRDILRSEAWGQVLRYPRAPNRSNT